MSIITPVYNVASFLDRCICSIVSQSYHNIELILIDDGSTDGSSTLCDEWGVKDKRIVVIHQENQGVSAARNTGLEVVKGDFLTFVDPDDFIAENTYASNMSYMLDNPDVDILQYPYCNYVDDEIIDYHKPSSETFEGHDQIFKNWWSGTPLEYVIWNKIYKRVLWDDVRFKVGHISEDTSLVADFVKKANKVFVSDLGLYYYQRERVNSYTFEYSFEKHMDLFHAHVAIYELFNQYPDLITEKILAFTRLYRRLITAKLQNPSADIHTSLNVVEKLFPSWFEIVCSRNTEKIWLSAAKILGTKLFVRLFIRYLKL